MVDAAPVVELVAHRSGNLATTLAPAAAVADTIEIDVHQFRGRLEVRHAKVLWPTRVLWEKWEFIPNDTRPPTLGDILREVPDGTSIWLDLKGWAPRFTARVLDEVGPRDHVTVSSRIWWNLRPFRRRGGVRTMRSVGSTWQVSVVALTRRWGPADGIVAHQRFITQATIARWHRLTTNVCAWAVTDLERAAQLVEMGVNGLIVDDLALISRIDRLVDRP